MKRIVSRSFRKPLRYLAVYAAIVACMGFLFVRLPTAFLPDEDQGFLICLVQLPPGATEDRTIKVMRQMDKHFDGKRKEHRRRRDHRGRLQLRRPRPEHGPRLRQAQGLEGTQVART